ncbi:hypothetical protein HA402_000303 [Bradysia odoriphaga]|nr:hypothetical protein HA402_000303 [Bradysia odoriphaga]
MAHQCSYDCFQLPCAEGGNMVTAEHAIAAAHGNLNGFVITNVVPIKARRKPFCRWRISYTRVDGTADEVHAKADFTTLSGKTPLNAKQLDKELVAMPPSYAIIYGLTDYQ